MNERHTAEGTRPADTPGLIGSSLRPGHPDLLDLPWEHSLDRWDRQCCPRVERLPVGLSRHPVVFVDYDGVIYALKELAPGLAEREYGLLREMQGRKLPTVEAVGHVRARHEEADALVETSVLVTRFLDRSLPYWTLFQSGQLARYREHLLDAMAILLVQLHLAGVFWGDCSLDNALFRRDAGALQAYLVDAETSEAHPSLSDGQREHDLEITEENVCGALLDLIAQRLLGEDFPVYETGSYLRRRYETLWHEIQHEEVLDRDESYRIQERIRGLNELGFSVDEVALAAAEGGARLRLKVLVADRNFHRTQLATLTGIDAEENQARLMLNEMHELKGRLSAERNRSVPLSAAAFLWYEQTFSPISEALQAAFSATGGFEPGTNASAVAGEGRADTLERYCELLEHKWYLSEAARRDVGHQRALRDYLFREAGLDDSLDAPREAGAPDDEQA